MQDVNQFSTPQIHNLMQVAWKAGRTTYGRPATSTPHNLPSLYMCGTQCIRALVCHNKQVMRQAGASVGLSSSIVCVDELCVLTSVNLQVGDIWPGSLPHSLERMDMLEGHGEDHCRQ